MTPEIGPRLAAVLMAQRADEDAVCYPNIEIYARGLVDLCRDLGDPTIWPVGPAAERLAGATTIVSKGRTRIHSWNGDLAAQSVLLVAVAGVSPLQLITVAEHARARGAVKVYGCGIRVLGTGELPEGVFTEYHHLAPHEISYKESA
jgi:hypothetical protein